MLARTIISVIAILIAIAGNYIYFKDVFSSKTKPHIFTWLIWAAIDFIACAAQFASGAGIAAFVIGANALCAFVIFVLAYRQGEKDLKPLDFLSLLFAMLALIFLVVVKEPLISILLVIAISLLGFIPTVRKSFTKPHEETLIYYVLMGLRASLTLLALEKYVPATFLEPASMAVANFCFVVLLTIRRRQIISTY